MRIRLVPIKQIKCNFCHNWMDIKRSMNNSLYICTKCLQDYQNGAIVTDQQGINYRLSFINSKSSSTSPQQDINPLGYPARIQSELIPWSEVHTILEKGSLSVQEKELIESRITNFTRECQQQAENILDFVKQLGKCKSQIFIGDYMSGQTSQRSSFSGEERRSMRKRQSGVDQNNNHKICKLNDICVKLNQTRIKIPYSFYFDSEEIQQFKQNGHEEPSDRCFGNDLSNISYDELFLNLNGKIQGVKSTRTARSNNSITSISLRMSEQDVKSKIDAYLEVRYQSISLQRILATNIKEAYQKTNIYGKMIELISFNISSIDLMGYLNLFCADNLSTIKLINVGLRDSHLFQLMEWICNKKVQSLVLTGNKLTDVSLSLFLNKSLPYLREIYLGKNRISKQRMKENIVQIRSKFILYI